MKQYLLEADPTLKVYEFTSSGPRGNIPKLVIFAETNQAGLYNLALGDKDPLTGELDDSSISNNGDSDQVLATVAGCVYAFFDRYPDAVIFAAGNTPARTRLYRMGLTKYQAEAKDDFELYGRNEGIWKEFTRGVTYDAFLVRRKK
ncbi:DUF6934 family protein [Hymenobacter caeli]|uniref:DUF695 domain-containing protein n=1 Tax=Hymenobacter caeli TaxID=2735894 RepID=A0ABX2FRZ9_9BACT|nr:hypothetical protein [Hymenobacter caeli]NRT19717.1 hypothetical protein [Hymenobacter caeli]